jgi:hypothetical protein
VNPDLRLERKHDSLKDKLAEDLQEKRALELRISQEFKELKRIEISLERKSSKSEGASAFNA